MSDDGAEPFPDDDLFPPGDGVPSRPPSKELNAFLETKKRLEKAERVAKEKRTQSLLLKAQMVGIQKKERKMKTSIEDRQATARRWAERYAAASNEAERQSLFKDELERALASRDSGVVQMLKEHARAERRRINESGAGQSGSYEPRAQTGTLPPAERRGPSAVFPDGITVE